jgi:lipoprotein-anchoring transpeptidase ErfK/SrfK
MTSRRLVCVGGLSALTSALAGCSGSSSIVPDLASAPVEEASRPITRTLARPDYKAIYGEYPGEKYAISSFDAEQVDPRFLRQTVEYPWKEPVGSVVIDPKARHLYFVESPGRATRYGVGVGREGFLWSGDAHINMKRDWPDWIPPAEMVARSPEIKAKLQPTSRGLGVPGGPTSPLGARAMYLFGDHRDLGYRIHGTTEPETIGTHVSSGCIRMVNQDIANLYTRASIGTHVVVLA